MTLFVYGSLKKGKRLNHFLQGSVFVEEAKTVKKYPMILSPKRWYPYLLKGTGGYNVYGEVYRVSFSLLKKLDRLEEVPHYYIRKKISVRLRNKTIKAWCYFYAGKKRYLKKDLINVF